MSEKSIKADLSGAIIHNAAFVPKDRAYQMCTKCIMDTTDPDIKFDDSGICSHCYYFKDVIEKAWGRNSDRTAEFESILKDIKSYGRNSSYDCIIGLSGGVDSSYVATKVSEWRLRPLVVHVDAGWNSELAVKNIENICKVCDFDLHTHVVDWQDMKDLQKAFLKANVANQDIPQDHAFFAALYSFAEKEKIKYVISGSNYATESILPQSWGYNAMDATHIRHIHKLYGMRKLKRYPIVSFFDLYIKYPKLLGMKVIAPLNYINYSKTNAIKTLEAGYGWRYYGGKHYESRWTRFFQSYYLPYKFGYDKRKAHLSSLILSGELSREEALIELKKPLYEEQQIKEDKEFVAKKLGITLSELDSYIDSDNKNSDEYKKHDSNIRLYTNIRKVYFIKKKILTKTVTVLKKIILKLMKVIFSN